MSSDTVARVLASYRKAADLEDKGHVIRSAELYGRGSEAASALGPDNLVSVDMQWRQADRLRHYAVSVAATNAAVDPLVVAAHRTDAVALLSAAVAALERRRVAGTLLEGKCTAAEEAWFAAKLTELGARKMSAVGAAAWAPLVGYGVFLEAADCVMNLLSGARLFRRECSATQMEALVQSVVHATDLLQRPRHKYARLMGSEVGFAHRISTVVTSDLGGSGLDARLVQLLTAAWQRLQRSGVLERRGILDTIRRAEPSLASDREKVWSTHQAAMTAPGLRTCALAGCGAKEAHPQHFKSCAACRTVVYCRREHQVEGWPAHKKACKAACKAKAAASESGAGPGAAS